MKSLRFSIITPVHLSEGDKDRRVPLFKECIESVKNQTYSHDDFEHIIVNDGSTLTVDIPEYPWVKVINQPHLERINAYARAFKEAKGEIFCLLDSDDAYAPNYLEEVDRMYRDNPGYEMFNFGAKFVHKDGRESTRDPFQPKELKVGHEIFGGGNIVNGTFVFSRGIYEDLGGFPEMYVEDIDCSEINYGEGKRRLAMSSPWDFSAYYQMKYPEIRQFFFIDRDHDPKKAIKELGNPWGQDFALAYQYTRKYHMKPYKKYLYVVHLK